MHKGSCLCGEVRYEIAGDIEHIRHCHCSMCRKTHGAAFGSYGKVLHSDFRFTAGEKLVAKYRSSPSVVRTFCRRCGSTLQWYSQITHPESLGVAIGTLDTSLVQPRQRHIYAGSKASWYRIEDSLPRAESCV